MRATDRSEEELRGIEELLQLSMSSGRYSQLFARQLCMGVISRTLHVHMIVDEIAMLEGRAGNRQSITKPEKQLDKPPLTGLWHKHFMQPAFIWRNLENYWKPERRREQLSELPPEHLGHHMVIEGYLGRTGNAPPGEEQEPRATGEWIVYAKHNGRNYYLTLGHHRRDRTVWRLCQACAAEFSELELLRRRF